MSHQQSSHELRPDSELITEVLEQSSAAFADPNAESVSSEIPNVSIESLQAELVDAQQQAASNLDKALRVQAEMENLKKRIQKDLDDERKYGLTKFAKDLLSVIDSLELGLRAVNSDNPEVLKLREGSELTLKQFEAVFARFNIEAIDPTGQVFNPELHQAMAMQPSATVEPGNVITTFQKAYTINGRLLRPAMVIVAKAEDKPSDAVKIDEQA